MAPGATQKGPASRRAGPRNTSSPDSPEMAAHSSPAITLAVRIANTDTGAKEL
jgi:hypothetical protein